MTTKYRRRGHRIGKRALTIPQFCRKWRISRSTYYDLQSRGLGPTETRITERTIRISPRAERKWVAKKEAGESAPVPVFAPQSSAGGAESGEDDLALARQQNTRPKGRAPLTASKPPNRRDKSGGATDTIPLRQKKKRHDSKSRRRLRPKERAAQSVPRFSVHGNERDGIGSLPKRQKERSKGRVAAAVPDLPSRDDTSGHDDKAVPRRRKRRSKNRRLERSKKLQVRKPTTEPQLDIIDLRQRLRTGKRLPKDALIESSRWRLDTNCHRRRDRRNERIMLKALIGAGSSEAEQRQALEQANCTPDARCRRIMCWLCKHRTWLALRRKLADTLSHDVPPGDISWVTIVIAVCEPSAKALRGPMSEFRKFLRKAADAWGSCSLAGSKSIFCSTRGSTSTRLPSSARRCGRSASIRVARIRWLSFMHI